MLTNPKPPRASTNIADWEAPAPKVRGVTWDYVEDFDARGMRRVYGRGDHFGRNPVFHMDVWLAKNGRLLVRFW